MNQLKNILMIGNYPPPYGGVPMHIQYLVPYLVKRNWQVHILSGGFPTGIHRQNGFIVYKPSKFDPRFIIPTLKFTDILKLKSFAANSGKEFFELASFLNKARKIVKRNKITLISAYHIRAAYLGAILSFDLGIPLITTILGDLYAETEFYQQRKSAIEFICKISKKILSCSKHCAQSFRILNLPYEAEVVYYGIDINKFTPANDSSLLRRRWEITTEEPVVLFVARMSKDMGLHTLCTAIPKVLEKKPEIKFVIAGQKSTLTSMAKELKNKYIKNIILAPDVVAEDLPYYYAAATLVVAPSINDRACLGLTIAEAMASEKPVIGCCVGGTKEILNDGVTGLLIPPENPLKLATSILNLIDEPDLRFKMGRNGRVQVTKHFDKDKINEIIERIFNKTIEEN